jgi:hypothetical protein
MQDQSSGDRLTRIPGPRRSSRSRWSETSSSFGKPRRLESCAKQGCQVVYFQTKNPNLGKFWRALEYKMLV